jgi:hypothetical protein
LTTATPSRRSKATDRTGSGQPAAGAATPSGGQPLTDAMPRVPKRRVPLIAWALLGAVAAGGYASLRLGMGFGPPLVMTALGGLTLVLGAGALWRVVDPLTRSEIRLPADVRAPHRIRELEREKQAVLKAIKEIELDYQMRKISEPDYREMIERYRTRALRVLGDLAAGDDYRVLIERELKGRLAAIHRVGAEDSLPATAVAVPDAVSVSVGVAVAVAAEPAVPEVERAQCPSCRTVNDPDALFCKRCGQNLRTLPSSVPA